MIKEIRVNRGLTQGQLGAMFDVPSTTVGHWERCTPTSPTVVSRYIDMLSLTDEEERVLKVIRKDNWTYNEDLSPISNELRRIRNGLGRYSYELSVILGKSRDHWSILESQGIMLSEDELDMLSREFILSSTTIKRLRIIKERTDRNEPIPEAYKTENPEIQEPDDLYDYQTTNFDSEAYEELISIIEDENGGSILNASGEDPKMIRLREMLGVIYYDEQEEHEKVADVIDWDDVL